MSRTATIFIAICMGVIALSVAAVLIFQFGRPVAEAVSLSLALMLTMVVFHLLIGRAQDRGAVSEAVVRLEDRMADLDEDVDNLEGRLSGVEHTIPRRTRAEIDPLFAEVEVLGSLINQMAEAMSDLETRVEDQQTLPPPPSMPEFPPYREAMPAIDQFPQRGFETAQPSPARSMFADGQPAPPIQHDPETYVPAAPPQPYREPPAQSAPPPSEPMTHAGHEQPDSRPPEEVTPPPVVQSDPAMRELITAALNANRVELHLQPVVTLPQRQVRYYEAFTRLRDSQGELVEASVFMPEAVRAGLIARIDNLLLFRAIQVVRRLTARNRSTALFCNVSCLSLVDETFFPGFLEFANSNRGIAEDLIFEFTQDDVAQMGVMELESLSALFEIGFSFSIDRITDMKMDFKSLSQRGFKFGKLHADYLIGRRGTDHGDIHPSDFGDLLHRYGMQLITVHVETESQVLELLDYEINLAQGNLFSPPRPVRSEVLQGAPAPAPRKRAAS